MENTLYTGDNLYILNGMNSESVDLIYLDPPFNSKKLYSGAKNSAAADAKFKDIWSWADVDSECLDSLCHYPKLVKYLSAAGLIQGEPMMAYCVYMTTRIIQMYNVLKPTGCIYLHCDPTASHYLKIIMDEIFGKKGFKNEIIWGYRTGGAGKNHWSRKHDTILFYAKPKYKHNAMKERIYYKKAFFNPKVDKDGRLYADVLLRDVWEDLNAVNNMSKEYTGYPTQKPLKLLERIIKGSSNKGDIVLDPFCGGATACVMAQKLERQWIGIDIEPQIGDLLAERLKDAKLKKDFIQSDKPPQRADVKIVEPITEMRSRLLKRQSGHCIGCGKDFASLNSESPTISHIIPKGKDDGDYYEKFHLLCGSCFKITHKRAMKSLIKRAMKRIDGLV